MDYLTKLTPILHSFAWLWIPLLHVTLILCATVVLHKIKNKIFAKLQKRQRLTKLITLDTFLYSINKPLTALLWLAAITLVLHVIQGYVDRDNIFEWLPMVSQITVVLILIWIGERFIQRTEQAFLAQRWPKIQLDKTSALAISKLCRVLLYLTGALIILPTLGIPISGVLALGGVGGIAVGFAAKEMLANFLSGAMLYIARPFLVNDLIELPEKNISGRVSHIGWRSTQIRLLDRRIMYVPNSTFSTANVINDSKRSHFRLQQTIGIRYEDMHCLPNIVADLRTMLKQNSNVDQKETIFVGLTEFGDSSLDCLIWCYITKTTQEEYLQCLEQILVQAYQIVKDNNAEIAYPTSLVHITKTTAGSDNC